MNNAAVAAIREGFPSYWGPVQDARHVAPGIVLVSTAGHGGFILSDERLADMPEELRRCSFSGDRNFEEDCSWCAVPLAWPALFSPETVAAARGTFAGWYGKHVPALAP